MIGLDERQRSVTSYRREPPNWSPNGGILYEPIR